MRRVSVMAMALVCACAGALVVRGSEAGAPPAAEAKPLRVVCFGDSITGDTPRMAYLDKYMKWSDLLDLAIEARLGAGAKVEVINRGLAGDTTYEKPGPRGYGAVKRLQKDLIDEKPDIAVILIGGNDKKTTEAERETSRANLEQIAKSCKDAGIKTLFLQYAVLGPEKNSKPLTTAGATGGAASQPASRPADKTWYHLAGNNDLIAAAAKKFDHPTLELQGAFDEAAKTQPRKELVNEVDGVHLSPAGELTLAKAVIQKLVELGWVK